jgi:hypothetical protein
MVAGTIEMAATVPRITKGQFEIVVSLRLLDGRAKSFWTDA